MPTRDLSAVASSYTFLFKIGPTIPYDFNVRSKVDSNQLSLLYVAKEN